MNDNYKRIRLLLDAKSMEWALDEMAAKLAKMHPSPENLVVMGMASRGIPLAEKLAALYNDSAKLTAMSQNCISYIQGNYSPSNAISVIGPEFDLY